jgi:predicted RNase H-like HicB family nuclease
MRVVILSKNQDEWFAEIPSLPGCVARGSSKEETLHCIHAAMREWINDAEMRSIAVPPDDFATFLNPSAAYCKSKSNETFIHQIDGSESTSQTDPARS